MRLSRPLFITAIIFLVICVLCGCNKASSETDPQVTGHIVTFDSMGGSPVDSQTVENGNCAIKPTDPTKEGFTFVEWQYGNATYDFNIPITQNITLTALFSVNEGTELVYVSFNLDNGENIQSIAVAKGCTISEPPVPSKNGFLFEGWYYGESKFDFATNITEDVALVAKWTEKKGDSHNATNNDNHNSTSGSSSSGNSNTTPGNSSDTTASTHKINFDTVFGIWYAEGHNDITLCFGAAEGNNILVNGFGFDFSTGKIKPNVYFEGKKYACTNNEFYAEEIQLFGTSKLTYSVNNTTTTFYREKDYPKPQLLPHEALLEAVNGYYWYLDGFEYTYLHPTKDKWDDTDWEAQHLLITEECFVAYENSSRDTYKKYEYDNASHQTYLTLSKSLSNDLHAILIEKYNMRVSSNKLYMTANGKEYSFTRHTQKKDVIPKLALHDSQPVMSTNDLTILKLDISPWWHDFTFTVSSSGKVECYDDPHITDYQLCVPCYTSDAGTGTVTIRENNSSFAMSINITVREIPVSGVSLNKTSLELNKGETDTLIATVNPSDAHNKKVTWSSSNTNVATVSSSGVVTAKGYGTAKITATTRDGGYTASCEVMVKQSPLTVNASIGMSTQFSSSSIVQGVSATVKASGGSEKYVAYSIKLYYEGEYVGEVFEKEMFVTPFKNGTYTAEVYVKDSDGNEATNIVTTTISVSVS